MYISKNDKFYFYETTFIFLDLLIITKNKSKEDIYYINMIIKLIVSNKKNIIK